MNPDTTATLIQILAIHSDVLTKMRNRIAALEQVLAQKEQALYLSYQTNLETENRDSKPVTSQEELANLQLKFAQT